MEIGIVGLLPEQVRFVQQEFPAHSLRFLSKDNESETKQFTRGCDKVVLMTKFIGHHIQDRVPPSKRVFVSGGIEGLKRELNKLPTAPKTTVVPKPARVQNGGRRSTGDDTAVDWSPLDTANVGDTVRIARPASVSIKLFDGRIIAGRSYRKKHRGIVTAPHKIVDGYAVMTVKAIDSKATEPEMQPVAVIETGPPDAASLVAQQEPATMQNGFAIEVQRPVTNAPVMLQARESAFWQSVFVETMRQWPGAPIDTIAARADEALRAYNSRASVSVGDRH